MFEEISYFCLHLHIFSPMYVNDIDYFNLTLRHKLIATILGGAIYSNQLSLSMFRQTSMETLIMKV
jgi:hypothetical protein